MIGIVKAKSVKITYYLLLWSRFFPFYVIVKKKYWGKIFNVENPCISVPRNFRPLNLKRNTIQQSKNLSVQRHKIFEKEEIGP